MKIWKFPLTFQPECKAKMPLGAQIIHFAMQGDVPTIWALVDPIEVLRFRAFTVVGTGHNCPGNMINYNGTTMHGQFVWHLFEVPCSNYV